jgi:DNA-binding GntR family transcriptional regulator
MDIPLLIDSRRRTAHELVRDTLRRAILSGSLAGGTRLVQADIATQLEVSTTPVREALRDLATEGLIRLDAHRGAIAHQPDTAEIRDLYDVRKILEAEAIKRATKVITEADLDRAAELSRQMGLEHDPVAWAELNRQFHAILVDAAGSPRLSATLASLRDAAAVYVALALELAPQQLHAGNDDHQQLLAAMRRRDARAAARIAVAHLDATVHAVEQVRQPTAHAS